MSERLEDHIDQYLPIRVSNLDGTRKEKHIFRLRDDELAGFKKLGGASVPFVGMAINMAYNRVPDFYDRVVGYRLCNDRVAEVAQEAFKEPYFTIEFFELDAAHPHAESDEIAWPFADLDLPLLAIWLQGAEGFSEVKLEVESEGEHHIAARYNGPTAQLPVQIRLAAEPEDEPSAAGTIIFDITIGSIYGVPPVPLFVRKFNEQERATIAHSYWCYELGDYDNQHHVRFRLVKAVAPGERVDRAAFLTTLGEFTGDTMDGILATEMAWIFSRAEAL